MRAWLNIGKNGNVEGREQTITGPLVAGSVLRTLPDLDGFYANYSRVVNLNRGQGDCAPCTGAQLLNEMNRGDPNMPQYTEDDIRAGMAAELRAHPGLYAHSIDGCSARIDNNENSLRGVDHVAYEKYVKEVEKKYRDFDNVEWQAAVAAFPQLKGIVFLKKKCPHSMVASN